MTEFQWRTFGGNEWNNPPAPYVEIEFVGPNGAITIPGMFDTGADSTELPTMYRLQLDIGLDHCAPMKAHGGWRPMTVVEARLDGNAFDMPVTFVDQYLPDGQPIVLFGRAGIQDHYRVELAPPLTTFTWIEGSHSPLVAAYDNWLVEWIHVHGGGIVDGVNYDHP